ncbi:NYN domain protein [Burkholderia contaminans FFH2055]|uniref:NYN domain-containing protein n=1 Tax=Burkholderia contaminans TaxID=488447 RepID=UPI000624FE67|nr:NYN domain-containing protein [Burkholderia contaminans]KKL38248.1 NYN domain protein [Burkholderia contaminans FFH2055]MEB4630750.1 NYN domain-containing protein [Burkholderia contaminans]MEB4639119.1 NYN domain-containing protein [Burkholderia contaminans]MEB4653775.1 NYN domain-containing protein [Burkholderia contaminans]MEB4658522.1 NYN domain-containing protein [Burkholderia contaminans]
MALPLDNVSMAVFCDFENVALGVRDAKYEKFDIKPVLERLLLKGSIVVKKAYCDWDRYKGFKASMHEASFELIEIPHVRQSGKNSADIRLVVDALDLCYTKSHVDTFVIISGDSDFSPLVSKLRENAKKVIGVGVKKSTSDLLVANCDEFIFYDDLVREQQRTLAKREQQQRAGNGGAKRPDEPSRKHDLDARKAEAIALAVETFDALASERDDVGKIWASVLKSAIKRRKPDFNESYYGFRAFGNLLDEAQARGLLEVGRDDKSGAFVSRARQSAAAEHVTAGGESGGHGGAHHGARAAEPARAGRNAQRRGQRAEAVVHESVQVEASEAEVAEVAEVVPMMPPVETAEVPDTTDAHGDAKDGRKRARKTAAKKAGAKKGAAAKSAGRQAGGKPDDAGHAAPKHGGDQHAHGKHGDDAHRDAEQGDERHVTATHAGPAAGDAGGERAAAQPSHDAAPAEANAEAVAQAPAAAKPKKPARKAAPRARRPRKTAADAAE